MSVQLSKPTDEMMGAFRGGVARFLGPDDPMRIRFSDANVVGVRTVTLTLEDLEKRQERYAVRPTGWRVLAAQPDGSVVGGDIAEQGGQLRMVSFSRDPQLAKLLANLRAVQTLPAIQGDEKFDIVLLRIPGILVDAFLLTSQTGDREFLVPIRMPDNAMELMTAYQIAEFFGRLGPLTQLFRQFDRLEPYAKPDTSA